MRTPRMTNNTFKFHAKKAWMAGYEQAKRDMADDQFPADTAETYFKKQYGEYPKQKIVNA